MTLNFQVILPTWLKNTVPSNLENTILGMVWHSTVVRNIFLHDHYPCQLAPQAQSARIWIAVETAKTAKSDKLT